MEEQWLFGDGDGDEGIGGGFMQIGEEYVNNTA
jgi:hypothetical protein